MKFQICIFALMAYVSADTNLTLADNIRDALVPRLTDTRIVGGSPVSIFMHPHQVNLRYKNKRRPKSSYSHYCGGSIYSESLIITASHCFRGKLPSEFHVVAGSTNREGNDGFVAPVEEIIMHENFNATSFDNDIAILVLGAPLPLNNFTVRAIELAENDDYSRADTMATVSGWGAIKQSGRYPDVLQEVKVPIIGNEDCSEDYPGSILDSMFCAGYRGVGEKDACQGDSGGPLVVNGKLTGVVSWGRGCAQPKFPGVYSKVSHLRPWIMEKISKINNGH